MSHYRAVKAGLGRDCQLKMVDHLVKPLKARLSQYQEICRRKFAKNTEPVRIVNKYLDDDKKLDFNSKTFQKSSNVNFEANKERERLDKFLMKCVTLGVSRDALFQIENLYECTNLMSVCAGIQALGSEIESRPDFSGTRQWPKKFIDKKAEERREKARANNTKSCTYSGLLFGAPTND